MKAKELEDYWNSISERVFTRCVDEKDGAGSIWLVDEAQCTVKRFLPEIINIVKIVQSDRLDPYIDALHQNVCVKCESARPDRSCEKRERVDCCLDRYYPLVVEAIGQ
jgi:hypothetical protein